MDRIAELNSIVSRYDLNNHPFYQEWVAGTLPVAKLQSYAADYGHFIGTIADGWETMGHHSLAQEERYHEDLWQDFRTSIGAGVEVGHAQTGLLVDAAKKDFAVPGACVGALYAFEAQQPRTAASKLAGLEAHYTVDEAGKKYFQVHADDISEVEILDKAVAGLTGEEFDAAKLSCETICKAMWVALDGIYEA
jgi:pyrroloquinoline quinone (PQQ) biosynthesis protein C